MSRRSGSSSNGTPMFAGILLGLLAGAALAAALAWYVLKSPSPFMNREQPTAAKQHELAKAAVPAAAPAPKPVPPVVKEKPAAATPATTPVSGVVGSDGKPRFQFYTVLADKPDGVKPIPQHSTPHKAAVPAAVKEVKPAAPQVATANPVAADKPATADKQTYYLQAGAFANADEAEKMKARLTLLGMEVNVQQASTADGVRHRVRLGPYHGAEEMNKMRASLKQNSVDTFPIRMQ